MAKRVLRCAAPAVLLALVCLLPFLNKAFTIDDPYFLYEAQQALRTPLTPTAVSICWENVAHKRPLSAIGSNGALMGYVLAPVILAGAKEWVGHLLILAILIATVIATVALAFRCGADSRQATVAGLLFASTPVVLGMAGTVMPDIPTTALAVIGMERLLAWKEERKIGQALMAALALGFAPLGRTNTVLLLPIGALILAEGKLWPPSWRKIRELGLIRWFPLLLAGLSYAFFTWANFHRASSAVFPGAPNADQLGWDFVEGNLSALGVDWLLTTAMGVVWIVMGGRRGLLIIAATLSIWSILQFGLELPSIAIALLALAGMVALEVVAVAAWSSGRPGMRGLVLWLLIPLPILPYVHLPAKYLTECAPAAAIIMAFYLSRMQGPRPAIAAGLAICAGAAFGVAIVKADAEFAGSARQFVAEAVLPHTQAGGHAWYFGQWALNWYSEQAGAECLTADSPAPARGDILVSDQLDGSAQFLLSTWATKGHLVRTVSPGAPGGRIYNPLIGAGFYSNRAGFWPWVWSSQPLNTYYLWVLD